MNIEVAAPEGYIPNVHSASRDDLHGLVDGYVRGKVDNASFHQTSFGRPGPFPLQS